MPDAELVIAFDFGLRRIGTACGDTLSRTAAPLPGIPNSPGGPDWADIAALCRNYEPARFVVGLPYNVDGTETTMSRAVRAFAAELTRRSGIAASLVDERYSSLEAHARLKAARAAGLRKGRVEQADIDAASACVILERWFTETT